MPATPCLRLKSPYLANVLTVLLTGLWLLLPTSLSATNSSYELQIAKARSLATEKSWALARDVYTSALALAPTDSDKNWCALWVEDSTWRSQDLPRVDRREKWLKSNLSTYEALIKRYTDGRPRDEFWMAVLTSRADLKAHNSYSDQWKDRTEIADYLASQPPSEKAAQNYVAFLQRTFSDPETRYQDEPDALPLLAHLMNGVRVGVSAEDRAWCAWQALRLSPTEMIKPMAVPDRLKERHVRWTEALALAQGTRWELAVRTDYFIWKTRIGWAPDAAPDTPANIPALLTEIEKIRSELTQANPTDLTKQLSSKLANLRAELGDTHLTVAIGRQFMPNTTVALAYSAAGFGRLSLTLKQVESVDWVAKEVQRTRPSNVQAGTVILERKIDFPDPVQRAWHSEIVDLGSDLKPGFYNLIAQGEQPAAGEPIIQVHPFYISGIRGISASGGSNGQELFVYSATDGNPFAGAAMTGTATDVRGKRTVELSGATDADGRVALPKLSSGEWHVTGLIGGHPLWFRSMLGYRDDQKMVADLFVDRPLYRPGETAHWKIILREWANGRFVVPANNRPLLLSVTLGNDALLNNATLILNEFGTVHGSIEIPATARPGEARLELTRVAGKDQDKETLREDLFLVDNFIPPPVAAKMELVSGAESLRPGGEVVIRVNAAYFSGGPVVNAPVESHFSAYADNYAGKGHEAIAAWSGKLRQDQLKTVTNAQGIATFRLRIPDDITTDFTLSCGVSVLPEGAPAAGASQQFTISRKRALWDPLEWITPRLARAGDEVLCEAVIRDTAGVPIPLGVQVSLVEKKWLETWLGPQGQILNGKEYWAQRQQEATRPPSNFVNATLPGWRNIYKDYHEEIVEKKDARADSTGRISLPFRIPHAGIFELKVLHQGEELGIDVAKVRETESRLHTWNSSRRMLYGNDRGEEGESLVVVAVDENLTPVPLAPDRSVVFAVTPIEPDKPLVIEGIVPTDANRAWISVAGAESVVCNPVELHGRMVRSVIDHPPSFMGKGSVRLSFASPRGFSSCRDSFEVPRANQNLRVSLTPTLTIQRPGADASVDIATADARGQPKRAELALSVADEAVVQMAGARNENLQPRFSTTTKVMAEGTTAFGEPAPIQISRNEDHRSGFLLNATKWAKAGEDIVLSSFAVESLEDSELMMIPGAKAGSVFGKGLKDLAGTNSLVTPQYLRDIGSALGAPEGETDQSIVIRRHFSSTAHWAPEIVSGPDGRVQVKFKYPDNLTQWRIEAYAVGDDGDSFGRTSVLTQTSLPLQARLQLPRFLIAGDTAEVSATLVNRTDHDFKANTQLKTNGTVASDPGRMTQNGITVSKQSETHATWSIQAKEAGQAEFSLFARAGTEGDAMALSLPIHEDGIQQETAATGQLTADAKDCALPLLLPKTLDRTRTKVTLDLSPSYAAAILDALPYLVDYPYGCVEQTVNRFLPAVIVRKTLVDLGLDVGAVEQRILGKESPADAARRQKTAGLGKLDEVVNLSFARLADAPYYSGGFGWWPGAKQADQWMTAYVVWGMDLARTAGLDVPGRLSRDPAEILMKSVIDSRERDDVLAFALAALARHPEIDQADSYKALRETFSQTYESRDKLSASGRACLLLSVRTFGSDAQREVLLRNLETGAQRSSGYDRSDTVYWGATSAYWRAMNGAVETTALTLLALMESDSKHPLIEPAVNWLVLNRRSAHWASTRDTAFAVLALTRYVQQHGELAGNSEVEVLVNGAPLQRVKLTRESLLAGPLTLQVPADKLRPGANNLRLRRLSGTGPVYAVALSSAWAPGDNIKPASNLIDVNRGFLRNVAQPTLIGTSRMVPEPLPSGSSALAGEEVKVQVTLNIPNDLEYVMVEVPKPAGCEPLNPLSGWDARLVRTSEDSKKNDNGNGRPTYREERDDKTVFFLDRIQAGTWEIRFGMRAITPGDFRALPVQVTAMYVPEITTNSDAQRVKIQPAEKSAER